MQSKFIIFILLLVSAQLGISQNGFNTISGTVSNSQLEPISSASVYIDELKVGTHTDKNGMYKLENIKAGDYTLKARRIGYWNDSVEVEISNRSVEVNFTLLENAVETKSVSVIGKTKSELIRESAYTVDVINIKSQKNQSKNLNQVLKTTSGINIRETGGIGSGFQLSLNGLSGNQIRYFIDDIPIENYGSALTLNNIPVNLIDNLQIYKGVVPITLGSDALGGAINITTPYRGNSFLDLSYSYGSFGTTVASINSNYATENNYFFRVSSFYNASDNDYSVKDVPLIDLELGNNLGNIKTNKFHDSYVSFMGKFELGVFDKKYADLLAFSYTGALNRNNYQHPDNNIKRVFGDFHTKNSTNLISGRYEKLFESFKLNAYTIFGQISETVVDTSHYKYNWNGEKVKRSETDVKGELFERKTLRNIDDFISKQSIGGQYTIDEFNSINMNFNNSYLNRGGSDEVDNLNRLFERPNNLNKSILGFSYKLSMEDMGLNSTLFGKQYWYSANTYSEGYSGELISTSSNQSNFGFGTAINWKAKENLIFKTSFEKAYRIPESYELLGDGVYVNINPELKPEESLNYNLGVRYRKEFGDFGLLAEGNYFFRDSDNFIRFKPLGPFGQFENLSKIRSTGFENALQLNYDELVVLRTNLTWQDIRDKTKFDEGLPNVNYDSRIPNTPFLFMNFSLSYYPLKYYMDDKLTITFNSRFVEEFYLKWENLGNPDSKHIIPRQLTHNVELEYSTKDNRYNFGISIINISDELLYDNYKIQKPSRGIYLKFRYYLI